RIDRDARGSRQANRRLRVYVYGPIQALLPVHIVAGGFAIVLGGIALLAAKGGTLHRGSGILFVYAMLTMGISASILALKGGITNPNFLGGFTSAYFVVTALTTVRPVSAWTQRV